ncbi:MAG: hypothetical protein M1836_004072 [Candelina mexicana]|nr:MAG: hypothetical protein M1836_004072 [Candelina mexicana]
MSSEPRSNMSKPNILQVIPTETLIHVCSYLDKKDIKSARLTCKAFNDCCEEFLIDRAVIAARYGTLEALKLIVSHPVFSRTVKTVIFDMSSFEQVLTNKDKYEVRFRGMACLRPDKEKSLMIECLQEESTASRNDPSLARRPFGWTLSARGFLRYCQLYQDQEEIRSQGLDHLMLAAVLQKLPNVKELIYDDDPRHGPLVEDISPTLKNWCVDPSKLSRSWEATLYVASRYVGLSEGIRALAPHSVDLSSVAPSNRGTLQTIMARPLTDFSHNLDFTFPTLSTITIDCSLYWTEVFKTGIPPDVQAEFLAAFRNIRRLNIIYPLYNGDRSRSELAHVRGVIQSPAHEAAVAVRLAEYTRLHMFNSGMANLTSFSPLLEHLRLDFGASVRIVPNDIPLSFLIGRDASRPYALKTLELSGIGFRDHELAGLLDLHAETLQHVSLHDVGCRIGSWSTIVRTLKRLGLESLSLRGLWGGVLGSRTCDEEWCVAVQSYCLHRGGGVSSLGRLLMEMGCGGLRFARLVDPNGEYVGP